MTIILLLTRSSFDPPAGHWGALQLVARYAELNIDKGAFTALLPAAGASSGASSFTLAVNWYPTPYIKYYASFERTTFQSELTTRPAENAMLIRAQLAF